MLTIDKLCYTSKLRSIHTDLKMIYAILTIIVCISVRSMVVSILILLVSSWLTVSKGGIPLAKYLKLLFVPIVFITLSFIAIIISLSPQPLSWISFPLGKYYLTTSYVNLLEGLRFILISLSSVSCLYFIALSTPVTDLLMALKRWHIPGILIELMLLMYRFIFHLLDIANTLNNARKSRLGNKNYPTNLKTFGILLSNLLILAFKYTSHLYDGMESRCYNGQILLLEEEKVLEKRWILYLILYEIFLLIISQIMKKL
ncbi:MAG TPA: cobalt ECF transporter T component CbiQ [Candidatus Merdenecus merdavium]|nr:cobalt ECF transporter T component CbiQ [Candidatus Merdenecus merdavium]